MIGEQTIVCGLASRSCPMTRWPNLEFVLRSEHWNALLSKHRDLASELGRVLSRKALQILRSRRAVGQGTNWLAKTEQTLCYRRDGLL